MGQQTWGQERQAKCAGRGGAGGSVDRADTSLRRGPPCTGVGEPACEHAGGRVVCRGDSDARDEGSPSGVGMRPRPGRAWWQRGVASGFPSEGPGSHSRILRQVRQVCCGGTSRGLEWGPRGAEQWRAEGPHGRGIEVPVPVPPDPVYVTTDGVSSGDEPRSFQAFPEGLILNGCDCLT